MKAYQCDRCEAYYLPYRKVGYPKYSIIKSAMDNVVDLCPECYLRLKNWLEEANTHEDVLREETEA